MILFDGHVHIYDCFDLDSFFQSAFTNFSAAGKRLQTTSRCSYYMLLAESSGCFYFKRLRQLAHAKKALGDAPWKVETTGEYSSLYVFHDDFPDMKIVISAGRQLITREKLELLALLTDDEFEDGLELRQAVAKVADAGGLPVCPWAVGKWLGSRGKSLSGFIRKGADLFFLGDNGGRPSLWPTPAQFSEDGHAARLVSGSDPLPLPGQERKVGGFGGILHCDGTADKPVAFLKELLMQDGCTVQGYGKLCSPWAFLGNQLALRLKK